MAEQVLQYLPPISLKKLVVQFLGKPTIVGYSFYILFNDWSFIQIFSGIIYRCTN